MLTTLETKSRNIDLVNSPVGTKFFILSRQEDVVITTHDREINSKNNLLVPEYYSFQKIDGKDQYKHKLTVPVVLKRSSDYILLMDFKTQRGDSVLVYLDKKESSERPILTIYNPQEEITAVVHPGAIIEVVFIDPENPLSIPSVDQSNSAFELEFIRREIVQSRDEVQRPHGNLFDIRRWVMNSCQCHLFFRVHPRNYEIMMKGSWEGQMHGPTIKFKNNAKEANLKVKVYLNKRIQNELSDFSKDRAINVLNQGTTYGLETGMFGGTQVMSGASKQITIDQYTGFQEIEIPLPESTITEWPKKHFEYRMDRFEPFNVTGRIQPNGFRVVNRTFLQKFLIISDMSRNLSLGENWSPIGKAEFRFDDQQHTWPVFVAKIAKSMADSEKRDREEINNRTRQVIPEVSSVNYYRKVMVAKEVKLIKIENNNKLFSDKEKIKFGTERLIEDPVDSETISIFPTETLIIRMTNQIIKWSVTSWPSFMHTAGTRWYKNTEEFKFNISCYAVFPKNAIPMVFESGKTKRKIFIKIIT